MMEKTTGKYVLSTIYYHKSSPIGVPQKGYIRLRVQQYEFNNKGTAIIIHQEGTLRRGSRTAHIVLYFHTLQPPLTVTFETHSAVY